jgi:hypothetical protein
VPLLQSEQHEALAVDLPGDDERASLFPELRNFTEPSLTR